MPIGYYVFLDMVDFLSYGKQTLSYYREDILNKGTKNDCK